mgnify:CR=1 FL=1
MRLKKQQSFPIFRVVLLVSIGLVLLLMVSNLLLIRRANRLEESMQALEKRHSALELELSSITGTQRTMKVSLYYYNELLDRALNNDVSCDTAAVIPVERTIAYTQSPINDVIRLLIRGELTKAEKDLGFKTEFPGRELLFQGARLDNGVLYLKFSDPSGFTTGGSCRVSLLKAQIEKTAMQFESVKRVVFEPANLFQP